jgi:hypothetical protein
VKTCTSRTLCLTIILLALFVGCVHAQDQPKTLVRWEFSKGAEDWYAAHSIAPVKAKDGVLRVKVIGDDPYMISSTGQSFDIQASDYQAVVIRAKVRHGGGAEFFWASSVEGKDLGFVAGKEIGFSMVADGKFHTYHVFPLWKDRVTRLRFDPPGGPGQEVWIDSIAIVEFPAPKSLAPQPVWDFAQGPQGFLPQADIEKFETREGKLTLTALPGQQPSLLSPPLDDDPSVLRYMTIRGAMKGVETIIVAFAEEDAKFGARQVVVPAVADGKTHTYLVETAEGVGEAKKIARFRVSFTTGKEPAQATLDSIALGAQPTGPPEVALDRTPQDAILFADRPRQFKLSLRNVGGTPVGPVEISLTSPAIGRTELTVAGPSSLAPGETWNGVATVTPVFPGAAPLRVRVSAPPAPMVSFETTVTVSRGVDLGRLPHYQDARAVTMDEGLWLSNDGVGMAILRNGDGYGPALLCVWDGAWKPMATIPALCDALGAGADAHLALVHPKQAVIRESSGKAAVIEFRDDVVTGVVHAAAKVFLRLEAGEPGVLVTAILTQRANDTGTPGLLRFAGPKLLAGDGTFGPEQQEALFPGLEWLVARERSSSTLDIAPPGNIRFAPHPNRITMPLMAVAAPGGGVVGIAWDMMEKWNGADRPAAVFASPNFLEHQDNHLMQLFLPSIPKWMEENHLIADRPYELRPGKPLVLHQRIFALPRGSVLDAVKLWYDRYGTPPLPKLPRSYNDTIALSIRGYEQVLYVKDKGWMGVKGWAPGPSPRVALHYIIASQVLGKKAPYPDLPQRALKRIGSTRDLSLAAHIGGIAQPLMDLRSNAYAVMSSQDEKGGWYFHPDAEHRRLGEPGKTTLGTVANNVAALLQAARIFHDDKLLAAGLKGLEFMEQFTVPRGAQVWEVPLHTPDILAAAEGVDACLAGYLATGEEKHLRRAVYWAEAGLPFLYAWQAPEKGLEAMRYGSIPVFGATWYVGSWFGRIVQWNGLAFASSLQRLAPYDKTYDWRHIAEGITRSGIIQQRTEKDYLGLYPDSVGMIDGSIAWGLMLGPQGILDNVFPLIGRDLDPRIEPVTIDTGPVTLIAAGKLSEIHASRDSVQFRLQCPAGKWMYVTLVGVTEPAQVTAAGAPLQRVADFGADQGYRYDPSLGIVEIKLRRMAAAVPVAVSGIKTFRGEGPRTSWDFKTGPQGWQVMHSLSPLQVSDGVAMTSITGDDPFMGVTGLDASADEYGGVRIVMRTAHTGGGSLYFAAGGKPIVADSRQGFAVEGGAFHEYIVDVRHHPLWRGVVTAIRIDPPGEPGDAIAIQSIALIPRSEMR